MRNGQNKRMRGRNRKGQNPLTRVYESNGPDVKIRGTANHVAEKYIQLARDAQASGDPVAAENYYQHAEHYFRLIAAVNEQFRQTQPYFRSDQAGADDGADDGDEEGVDQAPGTGEQPYAPREPQPFQAREPQPAYGLREPQPQFQGRQQHHAPPPAHGDDAGEVGLPNFITGGNPPQPSYQGHQNGHDNQQGDRFPLHRRRRRHRGPRGDMPNGPQGGGGGDGDEAPRSND